MATKNQLTILSIILGCVALNLIYWAPELIYDDKIIYRYFGLVIYKGGVPYRDAFDNKPPVIFFLNALSWLTGYRLIWIIDTALILLATLLFYNLCKKKKLAYPWFLPLLFNLIIRNYLICYGNGTTREYTATLLLIFFCAIHFSNKIKFILLGSLLSLTFWLQQDAVFTILPLTVYALFIDQAITEKRVVKIFRFILGFLIITIPIVFYFAYHGSLVYLWNDTFLFNLNIPRDPFSLLSEIKLIKRAIHDSELEMAFYISLILGMACLMSTRKIKALPVVAFLTLFASFSAEYLTGRMKIGPGYLHYLLPLAAAIPILVFVVFTDRELSFLQNGRTQCVLMIMLCSTLFLGMLRTTVGKLSEKNQLAPTTESSDIDFLNKQNLSDFQLYVFDDTYLISLYNKYGILSPSRWNYHFFGGSQINWDNDPHLLNEILYDLIKHKTRFILDCSDSWNYQSNKIFYPQWKKFLHDHYTILISDSLNRKLWRIQ